MCGNYPGVSQAEGEVWSRCPTVKFYGAFHFKLHVKSIAGHILIYYLHLELLVTKQPSIMKFYLCFKSI